MIDIVVGIDVGTTSVKALAVDLSGRILAETALPTPWEHRGAEAQIDPRLLADTVRRVLIALAQHENWPSGGRARGIGVAGMAETGILLDPSVHGVERDLLIDTLDAQDIETRPVWKPMHLQPVYSIAPAIGGNAAADAFERGVALPSGSGLSDDDVDRVIQSVHDYIPKG
jgi:hypothetical protein